MSTLTSDRFRLTSILVSRLILNLREESRLEEERTAGTFDLSDLTTIQFVRQSESMSASGHRGIAVTVD
jgi:hypothetical protein